MAAVISSCTLSAVEPVLVSTSTAVSSPVTWSSEGGGLTVKSLPAGYEFVYSEGTGDDPNSAMFHVFKNADGNQLSIGRRRFPGEFPINGHEVGSFDGVTYWLIDESGWSRLYFALVEVRIEILSSTLPTEELIAIGRSVKYDPNRDLP